MDVLQRMIANKQDDGEVTQAPLQTCKSTTGISPGLNTHIHTHIHAHRQALGSLCVGRDPSIEPAVHL